MADAIKEADAKRREAILEAKEEIHRLRMELDNEIRERRQEQQRIDKRLAQKGESSGPQAGKRREKGRDDPAEEAELAKLEEKINALYAQQVSELERLSGLSSQEAGRAVAKEHRKRVRHEATQMIKEIETQTKLEAEKRGNHLSVYSA